MPKDELPDTLKYSIWLTNPYASQSENNLDTEIGTDNKETPKGEQSKLAQTLNENNIKNYNRAWEDDRL